MPRPEDVVDADDVLVVETQQDLDLPQRALAVRLVLKGADFLDGDALAGHVVQRGAAGWRAGELVLPHGVISRHNHGLGPRGTATAAVLRCWNAVKSRCRCRPESRCRASTV